MSPLLRPSRQRPQDRPLHVPQRSHGNLADTDTDTAERRSRILEQVLAEKPGPLRSQAIRKAPSPAAAEEAFQEGFAEFLRYYRGRIGRHAIVWSMLAVKSTGPGQSASAPRRRQPLGELSLAEPHDSDAALVSGSPDPAEVAERGEDVETFSAARARLKPDGRTAVLLSALATPSPRPWIARSGATEGSAAATARVARPGR